MADKSLGKTYFPILRKTPKDAKRAITDPLGFFSCRLSTTRFFKLEDESANTLAVLIKSRKGGDRSLTLADGTKLTPSKEGSTSEEVDIVLPIGSRGTRTVILKTGNKIEDSKRKKGKESAYHTVSFRFPAWATILTISDALGSIIPKDAIKADPKASDVFPYFTVKGGGTYPIMNKTDANSNETASVATTAAEVIALAAKTDGIKIKKAAGGTT